MSTVHQLDWESVFPFHLFPSGPRSGPRQALDFASAVPKATVQVPQGEGKTKSVAIPYLKALQQSGAQGALVYVAPTIVALNEVREAYANEVDVVVGRGNYDCLYLQQEAEMPQATAADVSLLVCNDVCPHRVRSLQEIPAQPCPYYLDLTTAEQGGKIIGTTTARFLVSRLFGGWPGDIAGLVIDEADRIAQVARSIFGYEITDYKLERVIRFLKERVGDAQVVSQVEAFREKMLQIAKLKPANRETLLSFNEITTLQGQLEQISLQEAQGAVLEALTRGWLNLADAETQRDLKRLEELARDLRRYVTSLSYAQAGADGRHPLNYVCAYTGKRPGSSPQEEVRYMLTINPRYVAGLVKTCLAGAERVLAMSGTIGNNEVFGFETGIQFPFLDVPSSFPETNVFICLPADTPDLADSSLRQNPDARHAALRMMGRAVKQLQEAGLRSLVIVQSDEKERLPFVRMARDGRSRLNLDVVTYEGGLTPRQAVEQFKAGKGMVLVGTAANYATGLDLPGGMASAVFLTKPGYQSPTEPAAQFERQILGKRYFQVETWRVTNEAMQAATRGRRSETDRVAVFCISQQYGRIFPGGLANWLKPAWRKGATLEEYTQEAIAFLQQPP